MITSDGLLHLAWCMKGGSILSVTTHPKRRGFPQTEHYITIELGVIDKPEEECKKSLHKKNHVLLLCYHYQWHELEYIKNRRNEPDVSMYHSQEGRYADVQ